MHNYSFMLTDTKTGTEATEDTPKPSTLPQAKTAATGPQNAPQRTQSRQARQTPTEGQTGDTGTAKATGAAGAGTGSEAEPESVGGDAGRDRTGGATVGQAQHPQTVRATQSRPGCRRGYSYHRRRRRGAERHREPQAGLFVRGIDISSLPIYEPTEGRKPK